MMICNAEDLEDSKENIQPLKQGRIVSQLSMALKAQTDSVAHQELLEQQRYHETQIRSYEGDDPLEPWYEYVLWVEQSFVKDGRTSQLQQLLEKCLAKFKDDVRYKQDLRYVRLWITYIELQLYPLELYKSVFGLGVGTRCTLFYRSWAYEFERVKDFKNADKVYRQAFENCAEPREELEAAHQKFQLMVGQAVLGYEVPTPEKPLSDQRQVLSKLHAGKKGKLVSRVGSAVQSRQPGKLKSLQPDNNSQPFTIKIFNEEVDGCEGKVEPWGRCELQNIPRREVINKENTLQPGPWTSGQRRAHPASTAARPITTPGFPVHEDKCDDLRSVQTSNDLLPVLKVRKDTESDLKCPIAVFEPPDPTKRSMYCKDKVYAGNVEFSFEEIRANIYKKRYAQHHLEVEGRPAVCQSGSRAECCGSKTHGQQRAYPYSVPLSPQRSQEHPCDQLHAAMLRDVPQEVCGSQQKAWLDAGNSLDQSSFHSQSITVNTKEALKAVGELWKTPKDNWSPPPPLPPPSSTNKPLQRNVCHLLFPEGDCLESRTKVKSQSVPFQIYSDNQSVLCQEGVSTPSPVLVGHKPIKSILKPAPVQPCAVDAPDKENAKILVFEDEREDDCCLEQACGGDTGAEAPKGDCEQRATELPFVPSPGMSEEQLSRLKGTESKENDIPPGVAVVRKVQRADLPTGVLQPSSTVPFMSLDDQEKLQSQFDDLGVQRLTDNSEMSNETCNTQAFGFPLLSSTPFIIHSSKQLGDDHNEPDPDDGTINLMSSKQVQAQAQEQARVAVAEQAQAQEQAMVAAAELAQAQEQARVAAAEQAQEQARVARPSAAGADNLSVIMESSREYKSGSSSGSSGTVTRRTTYSMKESLGVIEELSSRCEDGGNLDPAGTAGGSAHHQGKSLTYITLEQTNILLVRKETVSPVDSSHPRTHVSGQHRTPPADAVVSGALDCLAIRSDLDPFSEEVREAVLKKQNFPAGFESDCMRSASNLPVFKSSSTICLGGENLRLNEMIGEGAYAKVMKATNIQTGEVVALKVQKCSCDWEFYISRQIRHRLSDKSMAVAFMHTRAEYSFKNGSVLVMDWLPYGSLLSANNMVRKVTGRVVNHLVTTFWTCELLSILRHLMKCRIIHGDIKPDNLMLRLLPTIDMQGSSLQLIDFGRSIDMASFLPGTTFKTIVNTSGFKCIEMQTERPWTYQTDLYGVAGTAHCLLVGKYMKTSKCKSLNEWIIESSYPRYCCKAEWKNFFRVLLNVENCNTIPDLEPLEVAFRQYLAGLKEPLAYSFATMNNILRGK